MQKLEVSKRSQHKQPQSILTLLHQNLFLEIPVASHQDVREEKKICPENVASFRTSCHVNKGSEHINTVCSYCKGICGPEPSVSATTEAIKLWSVWEKRETWQQITCHFKPLCLTKGQTYTVENQIMLCTCVCVQPWLKLTRHRLTAQLYGSISEQRGETPGQSELNAISHNCSVRQVCVFLCGVFLLCSANCLTKICTLLERKLKTISGNSFIFIGQLVKSHKASIFIH